MDDKEYVIYIDKGDEKIPCLLAKLIKKDGTELSGYFPMNFESYGLPVHKLGWFPFVTLSDKGYYFGTFNKDVIDSIILDVPMKKVESSEEE